MIGLDPYKMAMEEKRNSSAIAYQLRALGYLLAEDGSLVLPSSSPLTHGEPTIEVAGRTFTAFDIEAFLQDALPSKTLF